jgi:hypothetical protein
LSKPLSRALPADLLEVYLLAGRLVPGVPEGLLDPVVIPEADPVRLLVLALGLVFHLAFFITFLFCFAVF